MMVKFWGVRGSIPCPMSPATYKEKLSSIINRIRPEDIKSPEAKEKFISKLPLELGGTIGGNTTCLEVRSEMGDLIIVDGGTGIRELGMNIDYNKENGIHAHIFITHFHWDHLQGLPFFSLFFNPNNRITFYSSRSDLKKFISGQMEEPYFPVPISIFPAKLDFVTLDREPIIIRDVKVSFREVSHPGGCLSYKFEEYGKSFVFSTDTELQTSDFIKTKANMSFYGELEALIMDSQYTLGESIDKMNWGHSSFSMAVDFAIEYNIPQLYLFHHEPNYTDAMIEEINRLAIWYSEKAEKNRVKVSISREGHSFMV